MNPEDIDDFVKKTTILEQTINGIANGTIDDKQIDLREYGILTIEQQKEKDERESQVKKELEKKRAEREEREKEAERRQWWENAESIYGPRFDNERKRLGDERAECVINNPSTKKEQIYKRYSLDYSRWGDNSYIPDDEATKEEEQHQKTLLEKQQNEAFERANKVWCDEVKEDMRHREERIRDREQQAVCLRIEGNKLFKRRKLSEALVKYKKALVITPYSLNTLTNIAIVHEKKKFWDDAIEFCSRAIHIEPTCTKALFLRYKALLFKSDENGAMEDINRCIKIEPQNRFFHECQKKLYRKMHNGCIEAEVARAVTEIHGCAESTDMDNGQSIYPEELFFVVTAKSTDPTYRSMVMTQCKYMDKFRKGFEARGLSLKISNIWPFLSQEKDTTLFNLFVTRKLCKCTVARTYMRTSGFMLNLLEKLDSSCQSYSNLTKADKSDVLEIIPMIIEVLRIDAEARILTVEETQNKDDANLIAILGQLFSYCLTKGWETYKPVSALIQNNNNNNDGFLTSLTRKISMACHDFVSMSRITSSSSEIITKMATCKVLQKCILQENKYNTSKTNLVECLFASIKTSVDRTKSDVNEGKKTRKGIMEALLALSALHDMRNCFGSACHSIQVLLALSNSSKSELDITREIALIIMVNLASSSQVIDSTYDFGRNIIVCNGLDILMTLCCNNPRESLGIKRRASTLLSRLVISSKEILEKGRRKMIWTEFSNITSHNNWMSSTEQTIAESTVSIADNLLRIYISSVEKRYQYEEVDVNAIMELLPKPRKNSSGEIDRYSVCQSPEAAPKDSAMSFASMKSSTFHANLLKLLIHYTDSDQSHIHILIESKAIETLVCLLANSSNYHNAITKNASLVLARLVKGSDLAKQRCRDIRGLEILVELGKTGRI